MPFHPIFSIKKSVWFSRFFILVMNVMAVQNNSLSMTQSYNISLFVHPSICFSALPFFALSKYLLGDVTFEARAVPVSAASNRRHLIRPSPVVAHHHLRHLRHRRHLHPPRVTMASHHVGVMKHHSASWERVVFVLLIATMDALQMYQKEPLHVRGVWMMITVS